jgi:hypothetical protein
VISLRDDNSQLLQIFGFNTLLENPKTGTPQTDATQQIWLRRINLFVLSGAVIMTETFFVSKKVKKQNEEKLKKRISKETTKRKER